MTQQSSPNTIDYLEFTVTDVAQAKQFYSRVFGWKFEDWGPEYASFSEGAKGGFMQGEPPALSNPLTVLYSQDLTATQEAIVAAGGTIVKPVFEFPGGRRFHFTDTVGNTLAIWSE